MFGAKAATQKYAQLVHQKTGLVQDGDRFVGHFQGLPAWSKTQMVASAWGTALGHGGALGGLGSLLGGNMGGMAHAMTGGDLMMKHDYVIELTGSDLPPASLRESATLLAEKGPQQRPALGQKCSSGVAWIDSKYEVGSVNAEFIRYVCEWPELQQALQQWHYLNLSWRGPQIWLELMDTTIRIHGKFGTDAMQNGDMVHRGIWLVACAARATYAR